MAIPQHLVDHLMAECGRRCCICRRFQPLYLQVNLIRPESQGGTDNLDNLIALCITCHSSVRTRPSMTRNFTAEFRRGAASARLYWEQCP